MTAIEKEEKELRRNEERNEIYEAINEIENIKTEDGLRALQHYTEAFERTFLPDDSDDEDGISDKDVIFTKLPWDNIEQAKDKNACEKYCKVLAKKDDLLVLLEGQLEYHFDFELEKYTFLAVVMSKICASLDETRLRLVPDEVSDSEFWRNYFYQVELWKMQHGFETKIGNRVDTVEREQALQSEVYRTQKEIEFLEIEGVDGAVEMKVYDLCDSSAGDQSTEPIG